MCHEFVAPDEIVAVADAAAVDRNRHLAVDLVGHHLRLAESWSTARGRPGLAIGLSGLELGAPGENEEWPHGAHSRWHPPRSSLAPV
jgi:hypothetical protein